VNEVTEWNMFGSYS